MTVKTGSQLEPLNQIYYGQIASLTEVRNDLTVSTIAQIISNHILATNIRSEDNTWQALRWNKFIQTKAYDIIGELILNGMVWGESIAEVVFGVSKDLKYVVHDLKPLNMSFVQKTRQKENKESTDITGYMVRYGKQILDTSRLCNMVMYTQGGEPYPFGLKIAPEVHRLNELNEIWYFTTGQSSLGNYYARSIDSTSPMDVEAAMSYLKEMASAMRVANVLDNTEIVKVDNEDKTALATSFEAVIHQQESRILRAYLMPWMLQLDSGTGTYGAMQAWLDAYSKFVQAISNTVMALFEELASREAKANGLSESCHFINDALTLGGSDGNMLAGMLQSPLVATKLVDSGLITGDEIRNALGFEPQLESMTTEDKTVFSTTEIMAMVDKGIIDIAEARQQLGLPPINQLSSGVQTSSIDNWLSTVKKEAVRKEVDRAVARKQEGKGTQFSFTQIDRMIASTSLDKQTASGMILSLETQIKDLIRDIADGKRDRTAFDGIWQAFELEVKNAIHA